MKLLEERIQKDGQILPGNVVKVDSFLNQQIDVDLVLKCSKEWHDLFSGEGVTKILTIESTGVGIACLAATHFGVPVVYAKKTVSAVDTSKFIVSRVVSYTHGTVYDVYCSKDFLTKDDRVLIIDDFLANGSALKALIKMVEKSGATLVGAGIAIEKLYKNGGNNIRERGCRVESLAKIASIDDNGTIIFG
jgi:xanthine phosphoribosyltransferase